MTEPNVKVEMNDPLSNTKTNASSKLSFGVPFFALSGLFGGFAEQSVARARENYEKMKAASGEMTDVVRQTCSTGAKGAADYGSKILEISDANTNATFDFLTSLAGTKSLSEIINLSTTQSRKSVETASAQNRELWQLAQKVATETAEPIKANAAKYYKPAA